MKMTKTIGILLLLIGLASSAEATLYQYEINNPGGNHAAGTVTNILTTYDTNTEVFTWEYTIEDVGGALSNGFWLVVSDGENPKNNVAEYSIFYGDLNTGTLSIYEYSGANNSLSYQNPGNLLGVGMVNFADNGTDSRTVSFSMDMSVINALNIGPEWDGTQFASLIGIWFHPMLGAVYGYNGDEITSLSADAAGWYDSSNSPTTEVPEPTTMLLLASGLIGLRQVRRTS